MSKPHTPNGIGHFDVAGPDLAPLGTFYSSVLGWQVTPRGPGYAMLTTPEGSANGALIEAETPSLTVGIVVPDLSAALTATEANGGRIAMPLTDNGWVKKAQIRDPAGNLLTLIQG